MSLDATTAEPTQSSRTEEEQHLLDRARGLVDTADQFTRLLLQRAMNARTEADAARLATAFNATHLAARRALLIADRLLNPSARRPPQSRDPAPAPSPAATPASAPSPAPPPARPPAPGPNPVTPDRPDVPDRPDADSIDRIDQLPEGVPLDDLLDDVERQVRRAFDVCSTPRALDRARILDELRARAQKDPPVPWRAYGNDPEDDDPEHDDFDDEDLEDEDVEDEDRDDEDDLTDEDDFDDPADDSS